MQLYRKKNRASKILHSESGFFRKPKPLQKWEFICFIVGSSLIFIYFLFLGFAKSNIDFIEEHYSLSFYPKYIKIISSINGIFPFSVAEILLILFATAVILLLVWFAINLKKYYRFPFRIFVRLLIAITLSAGVILSLYTLGCMPNYHRYAFVDYLEVVPTPSLVSDLERLCHSLVADANHQRVGLTQDENGVFEFAPYSNKDIAEQASESYTAWLALNPQWDDLFNIATDTTAKPVTFSRLLSFAQITGFYFPYTGEANINVHTSQMDIPATTAHELAHVAGFMREDEANYIAYLVCQASPYQHFKYSGTMLALIHSTNALYGQDKDAYSRVMENITPSVRLDLNADSEYYQAHKTDFGNFSQSVNNAYLKANNQLDGVKSYGRMVDLLMADFMNQDDYSRYETNTNNTSQNYTLYIPNTDNLLNLPIEIQK